MFLDLHKSYAYVVPPILGCIVLVFLVLISLLKGRRNPATILFAIICFMGALINADLALVNLITDKNLAIRVDRLTYVIFVFSPPVYIQFVHYFLGISGRKWLEGVAYLISVIFLLFTPTDLFISGFRYYPFGVIAQAGRAFHAFSTMVGFTVLYCLITLVTRMKQEQDNQQKNRIKYIAVGMGLGSLFIAMNILPVSGFNVYPVGNFSFIPAIILAFGVLKYDLLDVGAVLRRGVVYFTLTVVLTGLYILLISFFHLLFIGTGVYNTVVLPFLLALFMVFLFNPIRHKVQTFIDRLFFRGRYEYRKLLKEISADLASLMKCEQVRSLLLRTIADTMHADHLHLFAFSEAEGLYLRYDQEDGTPPDAGQATLAASHPIVSFLLDSKKPLSAAQSDGLSWPAEDKQEISRLFANLRASLIVPMISQSRLMGMMVLGQKKSGELYVHEDLELLATMANQGATAMENATAYEQIERLNIDLEKKVEERTADLRQALEEKDRTQGQLIQSESLAAIGQLVAGTAHELNNPIVITKYSYYSPIISSY